MNLSSLSMSSSFSKKPVNGHRDFRTQKFIEFIKLLHSTSGIEGAIKELREGLNEKRPDKLGRDATKDFRCPRKKQEIIDDFISRIGSSELSPATKEDVCDALHNLKLEYPTSLYFGNRNNNNDNLKQNNTLQLIVQTLDKMPTDLAKLIREQLSEHRQEKPLPTIDSNSSISEQLSSIIMEINESIKIRRYQSLAKIIDKMPMDLAQLNREQLLGYFHEKGFSISEELTSLGLEINESNKTITSQQLVGIKKEEKFKELELRKLEKLQRDKELASLYKAKAATGIYHGTRYTESILNNGFKNDMKKGGCDIQNKDFQKLIPYNKNKHFFIKAEAIENREDLQATVKKVEIAKKQAISFGHYAKGEDDTAGLIKAYVPISEQFERRKDPFAEEGAIYIEREIDKTYLAGGKKTFTLEENGGAVNTIRSVAQFREGIDADNKIVEVLNLSNEEDQILLDIRESNPHGDGSIGNDREDNQQFPKSIKEIIGSISKKISHISKLREQK